MRRSGYAFSPGVLLKAFMGGHKGVHRGLATPFRVPAEAFMSGCLGTRARENLGRTWKGRRLPHFVAIQLWVRDKGRACARLPLMVFLYPASPTPTCTFLKHALVL